MSVSRSVLSNWDFSWNFILDSTHNGVIAVDKNGYIVIFNAAARRILNCTDDVIGRHIREIIPDTRLPVVLKTGRPELGKKIMLNNTLCISHRTPVLMLGEVIGAVAVFEDGAFLKNIANDLCEAKEQNSNQLENLKNKVNTLKTQLKYYQEQMEIINRTKYGLANIIGKSSAINHIKESIKSIAPVNSHVLLRGEDGTGKELLAHILYTESNRKKGPFVKVDCSSLPENLLENELSGKIEVADAGTIFLDEISTLSLQMQAKLLESLQNSKVRLIAATTVNLEEMVKRRLFREDLYYRLSLLSIYIPPLRDRVEDIEPLVQAFIEEFNREFGMHVSDISSEAYSILLKHSWPGNVKELKNALERAFNNSDDRIIQPQNLPLYIRKQKQQSHPANDKASLRTILDDTEKNALLQALQNTNGNKVKAAKLLGISRAGLYQKLEKYNLLNE